MEYATQLLEWCMGIEPAWVGFVLWYAALVLALSIAYTMAVLLIRFTRGWVLLLIPAVIIYCLYVAIFMQDVPQVGGM